MSIWFEELAAAACNAVLGLQFDWAAIVAQIPPNLLAHSTACFTGQRGQCLTGGSAAAFEGPVIGIERRKHECVLLGMGLDIYETDLSKE